MCSPQLRSDDLVVAFSYKRRGFCPSCVARRVSDAAEHVDDEVLAEVPVRQWVCSLAPLPQTPESALPVGSELDQHQRSLGQSGAAGAEGWRPIAAAPGTPRPA